MIFLQRTHNWELLSPSTHWFNVFPSRVYLTSLYCPSFAGQQMTWDIVLAPLWLAILLLSCKRSLETRSKNSGKSWLQASDPRVSGRWKLLLIESCLFSFHVYAGNSYKFKAGNKPAALTWYTYLRQAANENYVKVSICPFFLFVHDWVKKCAEMFPPVANGGNGERFWWSAWIKQAGSSVLILSHLLKGWIPLTFG